jgi:hypothetical protein
VEENFREGADPWSFRHTGVYHSHTQKHDLFILLHPHQDSLLEDRLLSILRLSSKVENRQTDYSNLYQNPYQIHQLILSSYTDNWRWYFRYLGDQFAREV